MSGAGGGDSDESREDRSRWRGGRFWLADQPGQPVTGVYDVQDGTLRLERELVPHLEEIGWSVSSTKYGPRHDTDRTYCLLGRLDDGTAITLARATRGSCGHGGGYEWQEFTVLRCSTGAHVTEDTTYETVEIAFGDFWSMWLRSIGVTANVQITGAGTTALTIQDGRLVVVAPPTSPMTAEQWSRRVTDPFCALLMLAGGRDVAATETALHRPDEPEVRKLPLRGDAPDVRRPDSLITAGELTSDVIVAWFTFVEKVVPVATVLGQAISRPHGPVEVDVLLLAACAEAIHRETTGPARMTFRRRLEQLVEHVGGLAEEVSGSAGDRRDEWLGRVVRARNSFARMNRNSPEDLYVHAGEMLALRDSLRWLLTAVVLQHIGIPATRVTEVISSASAFHLFRESSPNRLPAAYGPTAD